MQPIVELSGISKRFGKNVALDQVSLSVPHGTVFALLGENGAGKTTAIRIMLGLTHANSGEAFVLGRDSRRESRAIRGQVGYVAEQPTLYEWMTVDEIGWFAAGFYGDGFWSGYREHTQRFRLDGGQRLRQLSKGMRAKVALSLALAHDPELLILDEPTSGLDAVVRREFLESMVDRAAAGKTVFLSSHQIHEVERVADIVAIVRRGKLVMVDRLDTLKKEIRELTVTLSNGAPAPPDFPGEVLLRRQHQRQWQLLARGTDETTISVLRDHPEVGAVDVRTPSLEEIFVALMRDRESPTDTLEVPQ